MNAPLFDPQKESQIPEQASGEFKQVPWTGRDAWWGLAMAMGLSIIASLVLLGLIAAFSESEDAFLSLLILTESLIWLVPIWWFTIRKYDAGWQHLGFRKFPGSSLGIGCGMLVAFYFAAAIYAGVIAGFFDTETQSGLEPLSEELSVPWILPLAAVLVAPIVEEVFFRGFVFAGFRQRYGWQKAALISSAIFGVMHLQPLAIPPLSLLGYLFAYLYHRTNSIWLPILLHFLVNTLAVIGEFVLDVG